LEAATAEAPSSSFIPSARLEQDAHKFGLRESVAGCSGMGSPQQIQIRGFILLNKASKENHVPMRGTAWQQNLPVDGS
jgi:hypothetical protein